MSKYVWCEDSGSGLTFWTALFQTLYPDIIVQSKQNNTRLRKAVSEISEKSVDQFYVLIDNAVDNPDVLREVKKLSDISQTKENVQIIRVHSFEFVLLSFTDLDNWIFADQDELKEKRQKLLEWKDLFVRAFTETVNADFLNEVREVLQYYGCSNSEQFSAKLLYEITRNTGFETNKGKLGECFINDCCEWLSRQDDDICGLDDQRLTTATKMKSIYEKSVLKNALTKAGL